jgi:hypothetical protein
VDSVSGFSRRPRTAEEETAAVNRIDSSRIGTLSSVRTVFIALTHRSTIGPAFGLAGTVIRNFFWLQFQTKLFPWIRPVANVDHPLDETIPFKPPYVQKYLSFFHLWMRTIQYAYLQRGKEILTEIAWSITTVAFLYRDAGRIYRKCQSTTSRPRIEGNAHFNLIYSFDPHLHCIPSLHILVVLYTLLFAEKVFSADHASSSDDDGMREPRQTDSALRHDVAWIYGEALEITESILFIKQHSVNCVGASLFLLSIYFPEYTEDRIASFVSDLFSGTGELDSAGEVRAYILNLYESLRNRAATEPAGRTEDLSDTSGIEYHSIIAEFLRSFIESETESE